MLIEDLLKKIAEYDDVATGCAQVLGDNWEYEISEEGEVFLLAYVGPEVQ